MCGMDSCNLEGYVAEFPNESRMMAALERAGVGIPEQWQKGIDNFIVKCDEGRVLVVQFYNWDEDKEYGEEFEVSYDDVHCWA